MKKNVIQTYNDKLCKMAESKHEISGLYIDIKAVDIVCELVFVFSNGIRDLQWYVDVNNYRYFQLYKLY